jgi:hypothetical protein
MAEFMNDQARDDYLRALEYEITGYEARIERAKLDEDSIEEKKLLNRIDQVQAEIDRVKAVDVEEVVEEEKPKRGRGRRAKSGEEPGDAEGAGGEDA